MPFPELRLRRPSLLVAVLTSAAGLLAAVLVYRKIRSCAKDNVLLADPSALYTVMLKHSESIGHNVTLLRFSLRSYGQRLGVRVGEHIMLRALANNRLLMRPYTPVSLCDRRGSFEIIVKIYKAGVSAEFPRGGLMSQFLDTLQPGDEVQIRGPRGKFVYEGHGSFVTAEGDRLPPVKRLGLIAAGSGVTPMLQLLRNMFADSTDCTLVRMIDVNHNESEIIAHRELNEYTRRHSSTFKICHVLSELPLLQPMPGVIQGPLNRYIMAAHLPAPDSKSLILCCGPPALMDNVCRPALADIGYKNEQVLFY
ncbi:NADH-cytochrome b5 reductase 3-like [Dermacentor variabilis]|uniref:NADH-cytochrome b5 reductase 3-like n=1 Tax=Dermacentor variabilis TaxID=34621 RepID=UPI003F5BDEF7